MAVVGWLAREMWAAVKELKSDITKLREDLPHNYVIKDDFRSDMTVIRNEMKEIRDMLGRIFDKLDGKQDRN
jgi:antirestriction protein